MNDQLSALHQTLTEYRDLGLGATGMLDTGELDEADVLLSERTQIFNVFCSLESTPEIASLNWAQLPEFRGLWHEIQMIDSQLSSLLSRSLEELASEARRITEGRRTLKNYHSGEIVDTFFTGKA